MEFQNGAYNRGKFMTIFVGIKFKSEAHYVEDIVDINDANGWGLPIDKDMEWEEILEWLNMIDTISIAIRGFYEHSNDWTGVHEYKSKIVEIVKDISSSDPTITFTIPVNGVYSDSVSDFNVGKQSINGKINLGDQTDTPNVFIKT